MKTPLEAIQRAVEIAGGQTQLANKINKIRQTNLKQGHIYAWLKKDGRKVPAEFCYPIREITNGEVEPEDLRPDVFKEAPKSRRRAG